MICWNETFLMNWINNPVPLSFFTHKNVLFKTICEWSGINLAPLSQSEISELADYQVAMFSGTVTSPVAHLRGVEDRKNLRNGLKD